MSIFSDIGNFIKGGPNVGPLGELTGSATGLGGNIGHASNQAALGAINDIMTELFGKGSHNLKNLLIAILVYYFGAGILSYFGMSGDSVSGSTAAGAGSSALGGLFGSSSSTIAELAATIEKFISPIEGFVNDTTKLIDQFNNTVVAPVTNLVNAVHNDTHAIVTSFHNDLSNGLKGLVKLPGDLASSFDNLNSVMYRSLQQMSAQNVDLVENQLVPGLTTGIGGPLQGTYETFSQPVFDETAQASFEQLITLNERTASDDYVKAALGFEDAMKNATGFFAPIMHAIWGVLKVGELIVAQVEIQAEIVKQYSRMGTPITPLSPGEAIEAERRGHISHDDMRLELLKHGIDDTRQLVLYDLAQFLFGPQDSVRLRARNAITQDDFATLMDQNNFSEAQTYALQQLMSHILGPGDIVAAQARGYITADVADSMRQSAIVSEEVFSIIRDLELDLVPPRLMVAMSGRAAQSETGFLGGLFKETAPDYINQQFNRAQAEPGLSNLEWLAHWRVPGPEWWVKAYFRGTRTFDEMQQGFAANNVPEQIWSDVLAVEEELPPVWLIPDVVAAGVWTKEEAIPQLMKLGFSEDNATVLYNYGFSKSKTSKAQTAGDLQKVSLSNAQTMFDDGLIDSTEYVQILLDHGYSTDAANLTVGLAEFKEMMAQRNQAAQDIVNQANLGQIDDTTAQADLYAIGLTDMEVNKWLLKLKKTRQAKAKLPSEAQLNKLLKDGYITAQEWTSTMEAIGFSTAWANLLINII